MKIIFALIVSLSLALPISATITPTTFLRTDEPEKMCDRYVLENFGDSVTFFAQPSGGAIIRIPQAANEYHGVAIFCDEAMGRLVMFHFTEMAGIRTPKKTTSYGLPADHSLLSDTIPFLDSLTPPPQFEKILPLYDCEGCFSQPVDVAVSSCGRTFDPAYDFIYVLDQLNRRVVKLRYDEDKDSLIWQGAFGETELGFPTALDYADYLTPEYADDDIFVVDGQKSRIFRFSADGEYEAFYGYPGEGMAYIGYPTGIAVSTARDYPNRFYISDSRNHRVVSYYSLSTGEIAAEWWFIFPHTSGSITYLSSIDTDANGNVYVVDRFNHKITVLEPGLHKKLDEYGTYGFERGQFYYPTDIYIDSREDSGDEMIICEYWSELSGIQCFQTIPDYPKIWPHGSNLPARFDLYQNYPNPFNSSTTIRFDLPRDSHVSIEIFNILRQKVRTLIAGHPPAGSHKVTWDRKNQQGKRLSSGIYFYRFVSDDCSKLKKMLLLK